MIGAPGGRIGSEPGLVVTRIAGGLLFDDD